MHRLRNTKGPRQVRNGIPNRTPKANIATNRTNGCVDPYGIRIGNTKNDRACITHLFGIDAAPLRFRTWEIHDVRHSLGLPEKHLVLTRVDVIF